MFEIKFELLLEEIVVIVEVLNVEEEMYVVISM